MNTKTIVRLGNNQQLWKQYESKCLNEGLSQKRINKLRYMLLTIIRGFGNKDLKDLTRSDIEDFINRLNRNEFIKINGKNYSGLSKSDIKKFIKYFFRWLKGNDEVYPPEVSWIKSKISKDEKPIEKLIIPFSDAVKLANSMTQIEYRALTLILFDSGFRIDEFLSATKKDLTWEEYDGSEKCFWIRCNRSKTYVRKIPIPLFTEDIKNFVNSTYFQSLKDDDPICGKNYDAIRIQLTRTGMKILKRKITPHIFRHSSATYYARELGGDTLQLAQRYGWTLGSDELKTYVRLSGAYEKAGAKRVFDNKAIKLQEEVSELKNQLRALSEVVINNVKKKDNIDSLSKEDLKALVRALRSK